MEHHDKGDKVDVDRTLDASREPRDYDALVLPGGVANPDQLRIDDKAVTFARAFLRARQKPVAAICHGPWMLVEADVVEGREDDILAIAQDRSQERRRGWVDQEVVVDHGLVTSRKPDDLPAFCNKMVEEFAEGRHAEQHAAE